MVVDTVTQKDMMTSKSNISPVKQVHRYKTFYSTYFNIYFLLLSNILQRNTVYSSCVDDPFYVLNKYNSYRNCQWVMEKPETRCNIIDSNAIPVKDRCRSTCDNCSFTSDFVPKQTGEWCSENSECSSNVCRMNTCYASEYCQPIKQSWGNPFNDDKIVLVFVGSGFDDHDQWRNQVETTYSDFSSYPFFDRTNWNFNAFYVDIFSDSFCETRCNGSETRVCCDEKSSIKLAKKCFPYGSNLQTIVIHNNSTYGGAGYKNLNLATTTTHADSGKVAVHELGHSLFEFGDEYSTSTFDGSIANCDEEGCPKWADLSEYLGVDLCSVQGCQNSNYFIGGVSFMGSLGSPTGHVNLRFTCCTYLALTGSAPSYCNFYNFGDGLLNYCRSNDYQGYGQSSYPESFQFLNASSTSEDLVTNSSDYMYVGRPSKIHVNITYETFTYTDYIDMGGSSAGYFKLEQVMGTYNSTISAAKDGKKELLNITIFFESGTTRNILYDNSADVDVIDIIVDGGKGRVLNVTVDTVKVPNLFARRVIVIAIILGISELMGVGYLFRRYINRVSSIKDGADYNKHNIYYMYKEFQDGLDEI